ncbi:rRNA-binding ribosome biosynthesis protein utp25 [Chytriomyces hyalinus]|nr:rRNA-binding ribosome biosynthesis protein utp25 [Chytriomyces hyalinus]
MSAATKRGNSSNIPNTAPRKAPKSSPKPLQKQKQQSASSIDKEHLKSTTPSQNYFDSHFSNNKNLEADSSNAQPVKISVDALGTVLVSSSLPLSIPHESELPLQESLDALNVKSRVIPLVAKLVTAKSDEPSIDRKSKKAKKNSDEESLVRLPPIQQSLFPIMNTYADVLLTTQTRENEVDMRQTYCLHTVNHVLKTRDRVLKNTARLNAAALASSSKDTSGEVAEATPEEVEDEDEDAGDVERNGNVIEYRDQGFTRPKVLILIPFKNIAFEVIETIIKLSGASQVENKSRFTSEFTLPPEEDGLDPTKPEDYQHDFRGNIDDCFRIGIKFSRRHMKLFSDFYSADVIVASPLGLRMVVGAEGDKERDFDFLSSIEVVVVDRCDMLLMQNWDHLQHIFQHLNLTPKSAHDCDFARTKSWYLDGRSALLRQSILLSAFPTPEINALMAKACKNVDGRVKISKSYRGSVGEVVVQVPQMFNRITSPSLRELDDARFKHFVEKVIPTLKRGGLEQKGTIIFIPSYFDYVRVRNHLRDNHGDIEVGELCEYTSNSDISRTRSNFFHGKISILLMTERFHFFRRYKIRGCKHVVFYQLPEYAQFYAELLNGMDVGMESRCSVVYSVYDKFRMERVVGSDRVKKMMDKDTFIMNAMQRASLWVKQNPWRASMIGWAGITVAGFSVLSTVRSEMDLKRRQAYRDVIEREYAERASQESRG